MSDAGREDDQATTSKDERVPVVSNREEKQAAKAAQKSPLVLLFEYCINCKNEFNYIKDLYACRYDSDDNDGDLVEGTRTSRTSLRRSDKSSLEDCTAVHLDESDRPVFDEPNGGGEDDDDDDDDDDPSFRLTEREKKCLKKRLRKQLATKKKSKQILQRLQNDESAAKLTKKNQPRFSNHPHSLSTIPDNNSSADGMELLVCKEPKLYARVNEPPIFKTCGLAFNNLNAFYKHLFDDHQLNFNLLNSHYGDLTARFASAQTMPPRLSTGSVLPQLTRPRQDMQAGHPSRPMPSPVIPPPIMFPFGQMPPSMANFYSTQLNPHLNPYTFLFNPSSDSSKAKNPGD